MLAAVAFFLIAAIGLAACAGSSENTAPEPTPTVAATQDGAAGSSVPSTAPVNRRPGTGIRVNLAQGDWSTAQFQSAVYRRLLLELGYDVPAPTEESTLAPSEAFRAVADSRFHVWPSGLFPTDESFLEDLLPSGDRVGDRAMAIGSQMRAGVMEGILVNRDWAEANGISYLDDLASRPDLIAQFDANGDGSADIFGCPIGTTCHALVERLIASNGWAFTQITDGSILLDATARMGRGEPTLLYAWTPSERITELVPGVDVVWLAVRDPLPGTNAADAPSEQCPASPCTTGFAAANVQVIANRDFVAAHAPLRLVLERVQIGVVEMSRVQQLMGAGENSPANIEAHAGAWVAANRQIVQTWLDEAIAAG